MIAPISGFLNQNGSISGASRCSPRWLDPILKNSHGSIPGGSCCLLRVKRIWYRKGWAKGFGTAGAEGL